jgi:predicted  nucleic acid-binding Zn-ribbon protein
MPHQCTNCGHTFADGSKEMLSGCPDCGGNTFQFHPKGSEVPEEPPDDPDATPPDPDGGSAANTVGRAATRVRDFVGAGAEADAGAALDTDSTTEPPDSAAGPPEPPDPSAPWPDDLDEAGADGDDGDDGEIIDADAVREGTDPSADPEDLAQASARGEVAGPNDLAAGAEDPSASGGTDPQADGEAGVATPTDSRAPADVPSSADGRVVSEPSEEDPGIEELREQLNDQFESIKILEPGQYELNLMELFDREEYIIALQENGRYVIQVPENWMGDRPGE